MGLVHQNTGSWVLPFGPASSPHAYFLVGPTASGKTELSHFIARAAGTGILSADSMLVYKGMDIGTAKPPLDERKDIPYFGIDVVSPSESFNVARFLECAREAWNWCAKEQRPLLVVGGSGLYAKCLTEGLAASPGSNSALRDRAEALLHSEGVEGLYKTLLDVAPEHARRIRDWRNPRRLIRALELAWQKASPPSGWSARPRCPMVGLRWPPEILAVRIAQRVERMYDMGLIEETKRLTENEGLSQTACQAIGYAEAAAVLRGEKTVAEAMALTIRRTRQLAKRQMTWFRHQANVHWITVQDGENMSHVAARVLEVWQQYGPVDLHF